MTDPVSFRVKAYLEYVADQERYIEEQGAEIVEGFTWLSLALVQAIWPAREILPICVKGFLPTTNSGRLHYLLYELSSLQRRLRHHIFRFTEYLNDLQTLPETSEELALDVSWYTLSSSNFNYFDTFDTSLCLLVVSYFKSTSFDYF